MLKPEKARAELEKVRRAGGARRRQAALARLPKKLAALGRGLLDGEPQGGRVDELPAGDRRKLLEAFFPKIAAHVEAAWELTYALPYATGFDRKPFRAPHDPGLTRPARLAWFSSLCAELEGYEQDVTWLAAWAGYLHAGYSADAAGLVLAAAVNAGGREGDAVFDTLCASARGSHPVGTMGRHVTRALLVASRPDGWEFIEKLLLTPQRQEGLRQGILETTDEAHPEAFRRMLRLIRDHDLVRLDPVVHALNVWFGFHWDAVGVRVVNRVLERVLQFLEERPARTRALKEDDAETAYLALWATAFPDAPAAIKPAAALLADPQVERRFVAAQLLAHLHLPAADARLRTALDDADLRVALAALEGLDREENAGGKPSDASRQPDLFGPLERLLARLPEQRTHLGAIVWPWHVFTADRQEVAAALLRHLGERRPTRLIPHLPALESGARRQLVALLADGPLPKAEAVRLEELLTRTTGGLRRDVLALLLKQKDAAVLASAGRLRDAGQPLHRQAGLELLARMAGAGRRSKQCRKLAEDYRERSGKLSSEEQKLLDAVFASSIV